MTKGVEATINWLIKGETAHHLRVYFLGELKGVSGLVFDISSWSELSSNAYKRSLSPSLFVIKRKIQCFCLALRNINYNKRANIYQCADIFHVVECRYILDTPYQQRG